MRTRNGLNNCNAERSALRQVRKCFCCLNFLLLEHTAQQLDALEKSITEGNAVSTNKQQELTLNFLSNRVDSLEGKLEVLRDKYAEMKANGNGVH